MNNPTNEKTPVLTAVPGDVAIVLSMLKILGPPIEDKDPNTPSIDLQSCMSTIGRTVMHLVSLCPPEDRDNYFGTWFEAVMQAAKEVDKLGTTVEMENLSPEEFARAREKIGVVPPKAEPTIVPRAKSEAPHTLEPRKPDQNALHIQEGNASMLLSPGGGAILSALQQHCPVTPERALREVNANEGGIDVVSSLFTLSEVTAALLNTAPDGLVDTHTEAYCKVLKDTVAQNNAKVSFQEFRSEIVRPN